MKITKIGTDYVSLDESNYDSEEFKSISKIHLIKLNFFRPSKSKIEKVLRLYPSTNRYVISNNIRTYNYTLRATTKKYYVENSPGTDIISFFRKNNKVLVNFNNLTEDEYKFLVDNCIEDILKNTEVVQIDRPSFEEKRGIFEKWSGNVILSNGGLVE